MPTCAPLYVQPPTVEPYRYGLFSVAQMPAESDPHWRCGVEWEPLACIPAHGVGDQCDNPGVEKELDDGVPLVSASAFTIHANYLCRLPGRAAPGEIERRAREALRLGEQRAVEQTVWTGELGNTPFLADPAAVVLNDGGLPVTTPLSIVGGLAALESYLRQNYGGTGVIHAPAGAVPLMAAYHQLRDPGTSGPLRTWLGTPVAAYGVAPNIGPDGQPAEPGTAWLFATGPVAIRRGEVFLNPPTLAGAFNRTTNEVAMLAEREYVIGWDCLHAAVLVSINC